MTYRKYSRIKVRFPVNEVALRIKEKSAASAEMYGLGSPPNANTSLGTYGM